MLEPGQLIAETNRTIEHSARRYVELESMIAITEQQKLVAIGTSQYGRQIMKTPDVESVDIAGWRR